MNFKLSDKDIIRFIRPLFLYLGIFSITPWYDFGQNILYRPRLNKLYGLVLTLLRILLLVYTFLDTIQVTKEFLMTQKVLFFALYGDVVLLYLITVFKACFVDPDSWKPLLRIFHYLDREYKLSGKIDLKNFTIKMMIRHGVFVIVAGYSLHAWTHLLQLPVWKIIVCSGFLEMYFEFLLVILLTTLTQAIRLQYEGLNKELKRSSKEPNPAETLRSISRDYRLLGEAVEMLNNLFGHQIILIIFHSGIQLICCLNLIFVLSIKKIGSLDFDFLAADLSLAIWMAYIFLSTVLPINSAMKESQKFIDLLYKMQEEFPETSEAMKTLKRLTSYAKNVRKGFSASDFFDINKGIVFSVIGNVATYLIISIQLNESQLTVKI